MIPKYSIDKAFTQEKICIARLLTATNLHTETSLPFFSEQTTQYQESCCLQQGEDGSIILFKAPIFLNLWYFWKGLVLIHKHETLLPSSGAKNPVLKQEMTRWRQHQQIRWSNKWRNGAQTPLQPQLFSDDACDQSPSANMTKWFSYVWSSSCFWLCKRGQS